MNFWLNLRNRNKSNSNIHNKLDLTSIDNPMNMNKSRHNGLFELEEIKILLKENYSNYTVKINNLYPSFKLNNYKKWTDRKLL